MSVLYLDPRKEQVHCIHVVVLCLPEGQKFKISVDVRFLQQFAKQLVHFDSSENIEHNGNDGELQRRIILLLWGQAELEKITCLYEIKNKIFLPLWQWYPVCSRCFWSRRTCVCAAQGSPPQHNRGWINRRPSHSRGWSNPKWRCIESVWLFLSGRKGSLHRSLGIQPPTWKQQVKLWSTNGWVPSGGWSCYCQRRSLPDDAEHVDVCVVSREVDEDHSGPSVKPQLVHQLLQFDGALLFGPTQVLIVSRSTVCCQQAPVRGTFDLFLCVVGPAVEEEDTFVEVLVN